VKVQEWPGRVKAAGKLTNKQYYKVLGEMSMEAAAAENMFPNIVGPLWTSTKRYDAAENLGYHFVSHVLEQAQFGDEIGDIISYVRKARQLADEPAPNIRIGRRVDKLDGYLEEVYFDVHGNGDFVVKKLEGPSAGAVKTFLRQAVDREQYWQAQNITQLIQQGVP
jgi:hypothetical protein